VEPELYHKYRPSWKPFSYTGLATDLCACAARGRRVAGTPVRRHLRLCNQPMCPSDFCGSWRRAAPLRPHAEKPMSRDTACGRSGGGPARRHPRTCVQRFQRVLAPGQPPSARTPKNACHKRRCVARSEAARRYPLDASRRCAICSSQSLLN